MSITVASPPARPTLNQFAVTGVLIRAGEMGVHVQITDASSGDIGERNVIVQGGRGIGVRYKANGELEGYTVIDATITVGAALSAFAGTAGGFAAKAAALETWLQGKALLPT